MKEDIIKFLTLNGFLGVDHMSESLLVLNVNEKLTLTYSKTNNYFEIFVTEENSDLNIDLADTSAVYYIHELSLDRIKAILFGFTGRII